MKISTDALYKAEKKDRDHLGVFTFCLLSKAFCIHQK